MKDRMNLVKARKEMDDKITVKVHEASRKVIAICDSELIGKRFEQGKFQLEINKSFYEGEELDEDGVSNLIKVSAKDFPCYNIVGERSVALCLNESLIDAEGIKKISGIPHAMVF